MDIINAVIVAVGKVIGLMVMLGAFLTGTNPVPAPVEPSRSTTSTFPAAEATPTPVVKQSPPSETIQTSQISTPPKQTSPTAPTAPLKTQEQVNEETRTALVNILCITKTGISGISGSGVTIDNRGVILTNAHIGQYFLLKNYLTAGNVECTVRIGSPAARMYTATLLYLPPAWVADNASQLKALQATGTGEHDYAFLLITGRTDPNATLPDTFPHIAMDASYTDIGDSMLLAAYPAGFLSGELIEKSLYASSAVTYVTQLFSFDSNTKKVDLFSIGGTVVSQGGSSGGAVVRLNNGKLSGLIVTATTAASTGGRDLRAVSLAHINASLSAQGQGGLAALLTGDVRTKATDFNTKVAPSLTAALEAVLKGN